jgi:predicted short-subunit dehydrogenase-like oxidoreductase (DUF2520 family)
MNVLLIGSGNTATILGKLITNAGHRIVQIWSRNQNHANELARQLNAEAINSLNDLTADAEICIMAVSDLVIPEIADQLRLKKKVLVHTAGSVSKEVLKNSSPDYGVLYPLQSLNKNMTGLPEIPILIDGSSDDVKALLIDFASSFSPKVSLADDETRMQMHLSAVIVSNFSNHLYALMEGYCTQQQLNFQLLHPIIAEVANRLVSGTAYDLQTGPARRGDDSTIQKHLHMLKEDPKLQKIYQIFTESIVSIYHKK